MNRYILINQGIVVGAIEAEEWSYTTPEQFTGPYDTATVDNDNLFDIGENYSIEAEETKRESKLSDQEKLERRRAKMTATRDQAKIAMIALGYYSQSREAEARSIELKFSSKFTTVHSRTCSEMLQWQEFMGVTDEQLDDFFTFARNIDLSNLAASLDSEQLARVEEFLNG